jgi:cobalamin biosynthesis protein CobT
MRVLYGDKSSNHIDLKYESIDDADNILRRTREICFRSRDFAQAISGMRVNLQVLPNRGTFIVYDTNKDSQRVSATINIDPVCIAEDLTYLVKELKTTSKDDSVNWIEIESVAKRGIYHEIAHLILTEWNSPTDAFNEYRKNHTLDLTKVEERILVVLLNAVEDARIENKIIYEYPGMGKYFNKTYEYGIEQKINPKLRNACLLDDKRSYIFVALLISYFLGVGRDIDEFDFNNNQVLLSLSKEVQPFVLSAADQDSCQEAGWIVIEKIWPIIKKYIDSSIDDLNQMQDLFDELSNDFDENQQDDGQKNNNRSGPSFTSKNQSKNSSSSSKNKSNKLKEQQEENEDGESSKSKSSDLEDNDDDKESDSELDEEGTGDDSLEESSEDSDSNTEPTSDADDAVTQQKIGSQISDPLAEHEHKASESKFTEEDLIKALEEAEEFLKASQPNISERKADTFDTAETLDIDKYMPSFSKYEDGTITTRSFFYPNSNSISIGDSIINFLSKEEHVFKQNILPQIRKILKDNDKMAYEGSYISGRHLNVNRIRRFIVQNDMRIFQRPVAHKKKNYVFHLLVDGSGSMSTFNVGENIQKYESGLYNPPCLMTAVVSYCMAKSLDELGIPVRIDVWDTSSYWTSGNYPNAHKIGIHTDLERETENVTYRVVKEFEEKLPPLFRGQENKLAMFMGNGGTPEYDAIKFGIESLEKRTEEKKVMIILTDGEPGSTIGSFQQKGIITSELYPEARRKGINIIAIGFGHDKLDHHKNSVSIKQSVKELEGVFSTILRNAIAED